MNNYFSFYPTVYTDYKYTKAEVLEERKVIVQNTIDSLIGKRTKDKKESLKRFQLYMKAIDEALAIYHNE